ncbi:MAG: hypothetical protein J6V25_07230 [Oscillospiraceae bacterium]|nr:hypothetical protein [Oscillospiraceae bacterium]
MKKTYICQQIPGTKQEQLRMLVYRSLPSGAAVAVGTADCRSDGDDYTEMVISWRDRKLFYSDISVPMKYKRNDFISNFPNGEKIAVEYRLFGQMQQQFLQYASRMFQVVCPRAENCKLSEVWVYEYDPTSPVDQFRMKPFIRIQPRVSKGILYWSVQIPEEYNEELCMILATLPLTLNLEHFIYYSR